ncbi:MAG TPA: hypothetical protein VFR97_01855 [Capillimicrobium sp.]|nr:hypothetical protein [Capillimicrobium sp.]
MRAMRATIVAAALAAAGLAGEAAHAHATPAVSFELAYRAYNAWDEGTWWLPDRCTQVSRVYGSEPAAAGRYPVVIYLHGALGDWGGNREGRTFAALAAEQGFVAAAVTYDSWVVTSLERIDGNARCIFGPEIAGNPVAQLCARPKADCSRGVAVAGFSAGGAIAGRARNVSPQVRAAWLLGVSGPAVAASYAAPAGTRALRDDRLRIAVGRVDVAGGDVGVLNAMTGQHCTSTSCLRPDGSGFHVVQDAEVADGVADHCWWQSVNTSAPANSCSASPELDPGFKPPSTAPWSITTGLAWLRAKLS